MKQPHPRWPDSVCLAPAWHQTIIPIQGSVTPHSLSWLIRQGTQTGSAIKKLLVKLLAGRLNAKIKTKQEEQQIVQKMFNVKRPA
ncbi:MAG: hypothetical protein NDI90_04970 [Nitrospira sp. BO4]|jgi:hypothetical protein|nr:hypothetical protein [Nitrospira sp. BO4]